MIRPGIRHVAWILAWAIASGSGALWLAQRALGQFHAAFETDGRIAHRLLSQRVVQHDAVLATLALWQPGETADRSQMRLASVYPQIIDIAHRARAEEWPEGTPRESLAAAEAASRSAKRAAIASADLVAGRYWLVQAADPASHALLIDMRAVVPRGEWPIAPDQPVQARLDLDGQGLLLQGDASASGRWRFEFRKRLAADSQPFEFVAIRHVGWSELPWSLIAGWTLACALALVAFSAQRRQRIARRRAEELVRLGQVSRLNALGELAAGIAHELNQPLTAVLAGTQAARRMLDEAPPEIDSARDAMGHAVTQARRASEVVGRLRRAIERPGASDRVEAVRLDESVRNALHLIEPECRRRGLAPTVDSPSPVTVAADPVALEQVIHNLITNALQALERVPQAQRSLVIALTRDARHGMLTVRDTGPGIAPKVLPRIFDPFFTTRDGGLGLGLSLCETLVGGMGGRLSAHNVDTGGAEFVVVLPLADGSAR